MSGIQLSAPGNGQAIPQYPWNHGDVLYASALNAAIGNAWSAAPGAPFLPLSGGTLTGALTINNAGTALAIPNGDVSIGSPFGQTNIQLNPVVPTGGNGAVVINKVFGTHDGDQPQFNSYVAVDHTGGTTLYSNMKFGTNVTGNPASVWCLLNQSWTNQNNVNGSHVGFYQQQIRNSIGSGGTRGVPMWCEVAEARSTTGLPSSQDGIIQPIEVDIFANGNDDLGSPIGRTHITLVLGRHNTSGTPAQASCGISYFLGDSGGGSWKSMIYAAAPAYAALDTRSATITPGVTDPFAAVRMLAGHIIDFNGQGGITPLDNHSANRYLQYTTSGTPRLRYMNGTTELLSVDDNGSTHITANEGGWSSNNIGKQLLLTGSGNNPALGITDVGGANLWGVINNSGSLQLAAMPAYSDNSTNPVVGLGLDRSGNATVAGTLHTAGTITGTMLDCGAGTFAPPTVSTRSAGTKVILFDNMGTTTTDFALGIDAGNFWMTTGSNASKFTWYAAATQLAELDANGLFSAGWLAVGGASGPTWTTGSAAPSSTQPVGSLYSRTGGAVGATLYVSRGGGTWAAVAGV